MRAIVIVMDGTGCGNAPDAAKYGDTGANTLGHVARAAGGLEVPVLEGLGLGNIAPLEGVRKNPGASASWGAMRELSAGKDTVTGHWEMMGVVNETPFPTYPHGFPPGVIREFETRIGRKSLGNRAASGTEIIKELGEEHLETGCPIVYTSADSVFQVAAHEEVIPVDELYDICQAAREVLVHPNHVCRVIARPFRGSDRGHFQRMNELRRDFSLPPPGRTVIDLLAENGVPVYSMGKVADMFSMRGFTEKIKTKDNLDNIEKTGRLLMKSDKCFIFSNLSDFDTVYGHRNDPAGFARALAEFDAALGKIILPALEDDDYLFITADHGCDPVFPGTDHTREMVPMLFYNRNIKARALGTREGFAGLGATIADIFGMGFPVGKSFLKDR